MLLTNNNLFKSSISHENIGITDLLKETWNRVTGYRYNYRTRLIPFWSLIIPTSSYFIGVYFLSIGLEKCMQGMIIAADKLLGENRRNYGIDQVEKEVVEEPYMNALTQLASQIGALTIMYPVENVINRLIVQGTRTIIDNTDTGFGVIPINTRYDGFLDCVHSIHETEGVFGFYKGVGSLMIETALQFAILKLAKIIAYHIFDSEWTTRSDRNAIKNLMSSSTPSISPNQQKLQQQQQQRSFDLQQNKIN
jgi:solute carrier family 25 protein 46